MGIDEPEIDPDTFLSDVEMRIGEITAVEEFPQIYRRSKVGTSSTQKIEGRRNGQTSPSSNCLRPT